MQRESQQSLRTIYSLHAIRHPDRTPERLEAEVKNFLLRAAGLGPDARTVADGALEAVPPRVIRDASYLVTKTENDITTLYPRESSSAY